MNVKMYAMIIKHIWQIILLIRELKKLKQELKDTNDNAILEVIEDLIHLIDNYKKYMKSRLKNGLIS